MFIAQKNDNFLFKSMQFIEGNILC